MFQHEAHRKQMLSLMFKHHDNKHKNAKINDKKVKGTKGLLT